MPLIRVPEHRPEDLAAWSRWERQDAALASTAALAEQAAAAIETIESFARRGPCYASVSWGKDSTVLAHLVWTLDAVSGLSIPMVWIRVEPIANPHCRLVRDAFMLDHPHDYTEIEVACPRDSSGVWHATGTLEHGFRRASEQRGTDRYILGIRAEESAGRKRRMLRGLSAGRSCAPLGHWSIEDVFAYLHRERLPVHPAYAMSLGGRIERRSIRVASIGGERGTGFGRRQWEERYYPRGSPETVP